MNLLNKVLYTLSILALPFVSSAQSAEDESPVANWHKSNKNSEDNIKLKHSGESSPVFWRGYLRNEHWCSDGRYTHPESANKPEKHKGINISSQC